MTNDKYYQTIVDSALDIGERRSSKVQEHQRLLELYTLGGLRTKHFLNSLLSNGKFVFAEFGVHRAGSLCAALYKNTEVTTYAVDNWCYSPIDHPSIRYEVDSKGEPTTKTIPFETVRWTAKDNVQKYCPENKVKWVEKNWLEVTKSDIPELLQVVHFHPIPGVTKAQLTGYLNSLYPLLADTSIVAFEFYNEGPIQETIDAWIKSQAMTEFYKSVKKSDSMQNNQTWWAGLGVFVLNKKVTK